MIFVSLFLSLICFAISEMCLWVIILPISADLLLRIALDLIIVIYAITMFILGAVLIKEVFSSNFEYLTDAIYYFTHRKQIHRKLMLEKMKEK
jgi:hypothetical protein